MAGYPLIPMPKLISTYGRVGRLSLRGLVHPNRESFGPRRAALNPLTDQLALLFRNLRTTGRHRASLARRSLDCGIKTALLWLAGDDNALQHSFLRIDTNAAE